MAVVFFNLFLFACQLQPWGLTALAKRRLLMLCLRLMPPPAKMRSQPACAAVALLHAPVAMLHARFVSPPTATPEVIIGSVTMLEVKGDERVGAYRQQMQHLQAYTQMNALPQVRVVV